MNHFISIIIPTLNEEDNIANLIIELNEVLKDINHNIEIIIVDDNSVDNTLGVIKELSYKYSNLKLIIRKERGLSSAIIRGFQEASGDIFCVMDADFSHQPKFVLNLLEALKNSRADMVIASRYLDKSCIKNWSLFRKTLSKIATMIVRLFTEVKDPLSGFFIVKKEVIKGVSLNSFNPKICLEIIAKGKFKNGIIEVPYEFRNRLKGKSKLFSIKTMITFLFYLCYLIWQLDNNLKRFIKFLIVGAIGTIINLIVFYLLLKYLSMWYIFAAVISFGVAVTNNYLLNKKWTFVVSTRSSYLKFILISLEGLAINIGALFLLVEFFKINHLLAQVIAIGIASFVNFYNSQRFVFKFS